MQNLHDQLLNADAPALTNDQVINNCHNFAIANPVVGGFCFCPSATQKDETSNDPIRGGGVTHYIGSCGPSVNFEGSNYNIYDPGSSGAGPIGLDGLFSPYSPNPGVTAPVYLRKRAIGFRDIRDGSSNTIALGENAGSAQPNTGFVPHRVGWVFGAHGSVELVNGRLGYIPLEIYSTRSFGLHEINTHHDYVSDKAARNSHCFNSNHPGGAQFSFADGSVRFVSESADTVALRKLSSIAGGESVSIDF